VVLGLLGNFPLQEVDSGHCVDGFRWFWGREAIFLCRGLIWGSVWMVLGGFGGVRQFFFVGGLIWGTVWMVLGGFGGVMQFSFVGG
jgi:hypothetical protein